MKRPALTVAVLALVACSGGGGPDRADVAATTIDAVLTPAYERLADTTDLMVSAAAQWCEDMGTRAKVQQAWREAAEAWHATRAFRFGPVMDLRAMADISFPVDADKVTALFSSAPSLDLATIEILGADQRGLEALELVLFGPLADEPAACTYVEAAGQVIARTASNVRDAWVAGPDIEPSEFVSLAVNGMTFAVSDVVTLRLARAAGLSGDPAEPALLDGGPATAGLSHLRSMLASIDSLLHGGGDKTSLAALIEAQSGGAAERLLQHLSDLQALTAALPDPASDLTDLTPLIEAHAAGLELLVTLRTEVASVLGVTLSLGDSDGDS